MEEGSPPFRFEWLKNASPLEKSSSYSVMSGEDASSLTLKDLNEEHSGNYTCIVENRDGSDSHTARLQMKRKLILNYSVRNRAS